MSPPTPPNRPIIGLIFPPTRMAPGLVKEVAPGHFLRKATKAEEAACRKVLYGLRGKKQLYVPFVQEERHVLWGSDDPIKGDASDTYFAVIERNRPGSNDVDDGFMEFENAVSLIDMPHPPRVRLVLYGLEGACSHGELEMVWTDEFWEPTPEILDQICDMHRQLSALDPRHERITRSLKLFWNVTWRKQNELFYCVMLMSVVECLLTHSSSGRDDSISRQVQQKVPLNAVNYPRCS